MKRKVLMSLDEQIKLLESEINNDSGMSDDESDSDKEIVEDSDHELIIEKDKGGNILRMYSKPKAVIPPLRKEYLPGPKCGFQMNSLNDDEREQKNDKKRKRIKFEETVEIRSIEPNQIKSKQCNSINNSKTRKGLEATVKELLSNYTPTSSYEKRPFWCRVCQVQSEDEVSFQEHRNSEFHIIATNEERKRSECRICRKQFTSPEQLKEHMKGSKHKEKLASLKEYQQKAKKFC